jgi:hypothetical protein
MRLRRLPRKVWFSAIIIGLCGAVNLLDAQAATGKLVEVRTVRTDTPDRTRPEAADPNSEDAELPGAIYKDAMHPLDVVRQSMENWSDSELAALAIGMHMAHEACDRMKPEDYSKDDLYDLAHLCAFGQDWNPANTAAQRYLASRAPGHRAQAFAISIGAFVHLNAIDLVLATTRGMLRGEPYDAEVAYTVRYMKDYLELVGSPDALRLAMEEHEKIIDALQKGTPLKAAYGDAVVNTGALYAMAMEAAFFERYAGDEVQAAAYADDVERALPKDAVLTGEDRQEIDSTNLQYRLLGTELPHIPVMRSYKSATANTQIDTNYGAATVLVIFPDWCVQCKKMMPTMTKFGVANEGTPIHAYGLIFKEPGEDMAASTQKELQGALVMEISGETAHSFGTSYYPLGVVVDHEGMIRFIGALPSDAFNGDGYMERVITRMVGVKAEVPEGFSDRPVKQLVH